MKKFIKWFLALVVVGFGLLQLRNPLRHNPPVTPGHDLSATNPPPAQIVTTLHAACYDCHSYETRLPWYGHVAPVSWWLGNHVRDAREALNFSEWPHDNPDRAAKKWRHVSDAVRDASMPWPAYARIHRAARLTDEQRKQLADWAEQEAERLASTNLTQH